MKLILLYIRTLSRFKVYTVINIIGLALSLACVIIIFRYVKQAKKYNKEKHFPEDNAIFIYVFTPV